MDLVRTLGLKRVASTNGGEYAGPCPFCKEGKDRFVYWPAKREEDRPHWHCRECGTGDRIQVLRDVVGMSFQEAAAAVGKDLPSLPARPHLRAPRRSGGTTLKPSPRPLQAAAPPSARWHNRALEHIKKAADELWRPGGEPALNYLRGRGLEDRSIWAAWLGYNPSDVYEDPKDWDLEREARIWIPRGITIPWVIGADIWRLNVRRSLPQGSDENKYIGPAGYKQGLYGASGIKPGHPAIIVEGEFDMWAVAQAVQRPDEKLALVAPVATGSTGGSRRRDWLDLLSSCSCLLVAFDADEAGDKASSWWLERLPNARRWRPYWGDPSQMAQDGCDVRAWVEAGLRSVGATRGHAATNHTTGSHRAGRAA